MVSTTLHDSHELDVYGLADIGQGVNSAMLDIMQLYESVGAQGSDLNTALAEYQAKRVPESFALMRMVSVRSFKIVSRACSCNVEGALHKSRHTQVLRKRVAKQHTNMR